MEKYSRKIADAVEDAWFNYHGSGRIEIPVGVVATLALLNPTKEQQLEAMDEWGQMTAADFCQVVRHIWAKLWIADPYLSVLARPIWSWADDGLSASEWSAARSVAKAAISQGLWTITGYTDPALRTEEDVLGVVLSQIRSHGARKGLGEYHTPPDVTELISRMLLHDIGPGMDVHEPTTGTGGMWRAMAQEMRKRGADPAERLWAGVELDPIAAACLAVNSILWGLGPNVLIWCGDVLVDGDGVEQAAEQRRDIWKHHRNLRRDAEMRAAFIRAQALVAESQQKSSLS